MATSMSFVLEAAQRRLKRIVQLLQQNEQGLTHRQIAAAVHITSPALYAYLHALRGRAGVPRQIRVVRWNRQRGTPGNYEAVYVAGDEPDAERPKPLTSAERTRRWRKQNATMQVASE
jgi:hypothetical protein